MCIRDRQTPASSTDQTAEAPPVPAWPKPNFLTTALPHIGVWTQHFIHAEIPVMASTAKELEALRAIEAVSYTHLDVYKRQMRH